jgi:hypothetical protein
MRSGLGISLVVCGLSFGCATSFTGSPHVEDGRQGCEAKCKGQGMQVAGMVYMGEYSSACVCEVPRGSAEGSRSSLLASSAAAAGGSAGVMMQMQRQRDSQR